MWAGAIAGPLTMRMRWELRQLLYSPETRYSLRASSRPNTPGSGTWVQGLRLHIRLSRTAANAAPRRVVVSAALGRCPAAPGATRGSRTAGGRTSCAPRAAVSRPRAVSGRTRLRPQVRRAARARALQPMGADRAPHLSANMNCSGWPSRCRASGQRRSRSSSYVDMSCAQTRASARAAAPHGSRASRADARFSPWTARMAPVINEDHLMINLNLKFLKI